MSNTPFCNAIVPYVGEASAEEATDTNLEEVLQQGEVVGYRHKRYVLNRPTFDAMRLAVEESELSAHEMVILRNTGEM